MTLNQVQGDLRETESQGDMWASMPQGACGIRPLADNGGHVDGLRGALELPGDLDVHLLGVDMGHVFEI